MGWVETNSSFPFVGGTPDFSEYFELLLSGKTQKSINTQPEA